MRTGPHLGGGPAWTGPDPAGHGPRGRNSATASVHGGTSSPSGGCPAGAALCGPPVGRPTFTLRHSAQFRPNGMSLDRAGTDQVGSMSTTDEGVTGFDFGG